MNRLAKRLLWSESKYIVMPGYDSDDAESILVTWPPARFEQLTPRIEDEYSSLAHPRRAAKQSADSIGNLIRRMEDELPIYPGELGVSPDGRVLWHQGRHRARAAQKVMVSMPVRVWVETSPYQRLPVSQWPPELMSRIRSGDLTPQ